MKVSKTNLEFIDFLIVHTEYAFLDPKKGTSIRDLFNSYEIDLDFGKQKEVLQNGTTRINIQIQVMINMVEKPLPGYKIKAIGIGLYELKPDEKPGNKEAENLENISALGISINAMRNYIAQLTANGPLGKFVLPAVNVNDLIREKEKARIIKSKNEGK